ncbi:MAG: DUF1887 family protein [Oscillospiraceae bacterium]|jgi:hypothetical protein|nr:DUF1887 family protein [Oscillospiraceae bacterium]
MHTVIELFDKEQILNVLLPLALPAKTVVFVGSHHMKEYRESLERFFAMQKMELSLYFYTVDTSDCEAIMSVLKKVLERFPQSVVDVSGGQDLPLVVSGVFCRENHVPMYWFEKNKHRFIKVYGSASAPEVEWQGRLNYNDFITLAGGSSLRRGHYFTSEFSSKMYGEILEIWKIYFKNPQKWAHNAMYFQQISGLASEENGLCVDSPLKINQEGGKYFEAQPEVLEELAAIGVLQKLRLTGGRVSYSYKNEMLKRWLNDVGIWLELYTYITAKRTGYFDSAQTSVVVDWDGKYSRECNTTNEIDAILTKGLRAVFISCKVGLPTTIALNEIYVLAKRFGGEWAKAVLVTASKFSQDSPSVYQRARDLGVHVVEYADIAAGKLGKRLVEIASEKGEIKCL